MMMISVPDFHSHILPGIDDGSKSAEMSLGMLNEIAAQGIGQVVATPHFYPDKDGISRFLARREQAMQKLLTVYDETKHPKIYVGAEVAYFHGISHSEQLEKLCIEGTRCILLEMPFSHWTNEMLRELYAIQEELDLQPILAHIERYISFQKRTTIPMLVQNGVLIQSNAEFFANSKTMKKALKMLVRDEIHFLGSDCHNLSTRPPNLQQAVQRLRENGLTEELNKLQRRGQEMLSAAYPILI